MPSAENQIVEYASESAGEFGRPSAGDAAFEQLLRLAASYSSSPPAAWRGQSRSSFRKSPVAEDIELCAYHIYMDRGAADGHDLDDWLQAERQVLEDLKRNKASLRVALAFGVSREPHR